ncbi:MAG: DUF4230 domain-containing protein [Polymorphobacter sp.]
MSGKIILAALTGVGITIAGYSVWQKRGEIAEKILEDKISEDTDSSKILNTALVSFRNINRLTVSAAGVSGVTTIRQAGPFGAEIGANYKTIIVAGTVRYDLDLSKLTDKNIRWDSVKKTLFVNVPGIIVSQPSPDMRSMVEYKKGLEIPFVYDERAITKKAWNEIYSKMYIAARNPLYLNMAKESGRAAVTNNLELPLRAAGIDARVEVHFPGEKA